MGGKSGKFNSQNQHFIWKIPKYVITQSILKQSKSQRQSTITERTDFGHFSTKNSQINILEGTLWSFDILDGNFTINNHNQQNQHFGRKILKSVPYPSKIHFNLPNC